MPIKNLSILILAFLLLGFACSREQQAPDQDKKSFGQEELLKVNRILLKKDQQRIAAHIQRVEWNMQETETGLWWQILQEGSGKLVAGGDEITLEYTLSLLDGTMLYSSAETGVKTFIVGKGGVESGLEQGVLLCRQGTKARFILPPHLAHGLTGDGDRIPARAILVYEIELIELLKPSAHEE